MLLFVVPVQQFRAGVVCSVFSSGQVPSVLHATLNTPDIKSMLTACAF